MLLLRDILYDDAGKVKPTRLSALLNAGLGYVADAKQVRGRFEQVLGVCVCVCVWKGGVKEVGVCRVCRVWVR